MDRSTRIRQAAQRYTDNNQLAGIEWRVQVSGETLSEGQVGLASPHTGTAIPDQAIYRIYSMTKPVVSVMALIAIEQGLISLFDPLARFNPEFANMQVLSPQGKLEPAARLITVEDLLTHRSGFSYEFLNNCHIAAGYSSIKLSSDGACSLDEVMAKLASQPLACQPGNEFKYSVSTDALAHILEKVTGKTLQDLLKEYIFEPLEMPDTGFSVAKAKAHRIMPMFGEQDFSKIMTPRPAAQQELNHIEVDEMYPSNDPNFRRGGHGLFSTLDDYCQFAEMLLTGASRHGEIIISRKTHEMMLRNRIPAEQLPIKIGSLPLAGYGWGLGVRLMLDTGQAMSLTGEGEFGWAGAASTNFWVDPIENMTGVILTQYLGSTLPLIDAMRTASYQMLK